MFSENAVQIIQKRYLDEGQTIETWLQGIVEDLVSVEQPILRDYYKKEFYDVLINRKCVLNSPILMNYGKAGRKKQGSACFVVEMRDDLASIGETKKIAMLIHQTGGGTGMNFSVLRPAGAIVASTGKPSSGVIPFMESFHWDCHAVSQGGVRRGAWMGILGVWHPDIEEFIKIKSDINRLTGFNLSVGVTEEFMKAVENNTDWDLIFPDYEKMDKGIYNKEWNGDIVTWIKKGYPIKVYKTVKAKELFDKIVFYAHKSGEPGLIFLDRLNINSPHPDEPIIATNPCGEVPARAWESCVLGHVNLTCFIDENGKILFSDLEDTVYLLVRMLDNVVDINEYPIQKIKEEHGKYRKIGVGITGLADTLIKLGVAYDSREGREVASELLGLVQKYAHNASKRLAVEKGAYAEGKNMRNATVTVIAPTGTTSIITGVEGYGCEPLYALAYKRKLHDGTEQMYVSDLFVECAMKNGFYSEELMQKVIETGTANHQEVPEKWQKVFKTANEISYESHLLMQSALQNYVDLAISKTINMPSDASIEDIYDAYMLAYQLGNIKGITVYRDGSRDNVLKTLSKSKIKEDKSRKEVAIEAAFEELPSIKKRIMTGCGKLYIHVDYHPETKVIKEVFIDKGSEGGCQIFTKATSRLISKSLRAGIPLKVIIDELLDAGSCPSYQYARGKGVAVAKGKSCPSAIAYALLELAEKINTINVVSPENKIFIPMIDDLYNDIMFCPECGNPMPKLGCYTCSVCGYSKC